PLELVESERLREAVEAALAGGRRIAVLARRAPMPGEALSWRRMPEDARAYGRALYAALRALDAAGADRILAEAVPSGEAWTAIADRLARAAARGDAAKGEVVDAT
ncbi:MAG: Sua5 family C-terminal domain-containing protein, partial [Steroidobacteraceae bacterium]